MVRLNEGKNMNLQEIIEAVLIETDDLDEVEEVASAIVEKLRENLSIIVEMRYAQRAYFRRRVEDNLSKAKSLEKLVDEILIPFDHKRNLPIQIDILVIY
jgi:hypothetical protein